jgi:hypothetical protein
MARLRVVPAAEKPAAIVAFETHEQVVAHNRTSAAARPFARTVLVAIRSHALTNHYGRSRNPVIDIDFSLGPLSLQIAFLERAGVYEELLF